MVAGMGRTCGGKLRNRSNMLVHLSIHQPDPWRNGSASDSRSEGCVFDSRRVQNPDPTGIPFSPSGYFFFSITTSKRPTAQPIRNKPAQGLPLAPPNLNPHHASRSFLSPSPTPVSDLPPLAPARTKPSERGADEPSRPRSLSPPRRSHGDRHAEDQRYRG